MIIIQISKNNIFLLGVQCFRTYRSNAVICRNIITLRRPNVSCALTNRPNINHRGLDFVTTSSVYNYVILNNVSVSASLCLQRYYSKKNRKVADSDSESSDEELDVIDKYDRSSKIIKTSLPSLRTDIVLKSALGLARNKVDLAFYESRIRVNGEKILKKSQRVNVGDEVDVIKGISPLNPDFLNVSRIEIISAKSDEEEEILVCMRRFKTLQIENYENNPFKPRESS